MKISNEAKIGLFATLTIAAAFWGYKFLKGESIVNRSITLYVELEDAQQINKSAPIYFHGVEIGKVVDIFFKPDQNLTKATLALNFKQNPGIPKDARAVLFSNGILNGRAINLDFDHPCNSTDCAAVQGDYIKGVSLSPIESMIGKPKEMDPYLDKLTGSVNSLVDNLNKNLKNPDNEVGKSLRDVQATLISLRQATASLSQLMAASTGTLNSTLRNVESITGNLKTNNDRISSILTDANSLTTKANTLDFSKVNKAADGAGESIDGLKKTLAETQNALRELTITISKLNGGSGTVGQLMTNDSVYQNLNLTLIHTQALMQDLRLNPKRYLSLNPFRKYRTYQVPAQDPLMDTLQLRFDKLRRK